MLVMSLIPPSVNSDEFDTWVDAFLHLQHRLSKQVQISRETLIEILLYFADSSTEEDVWDRLRQDIKDLPTSAYPEDWWGIGFPPELLPDGPNSPAVSMMRPMAGTHYKPEIRIETGDNPIEFRFEFLHGHSPENPHSTGKPKVFPVVSLILGPDIHIASVLLKLCVTALYYKGITMEYISTRLLCRKTADTGMAFDSLKESSIQESVEEYRHVLDGRLDKMAGDEFKMAHQVAAAEDVKKALFEADDHEPSNASLVQKVLKDMLPPEEFEKMKKISEALGHAGGIAIPVPEELTEELRERLKAHGVKFIDHGAYDPNDIKALIEGDSPQSGDFQKLDIDDIMDQLES